MSKSTEADGDEGVWKAIQRLWAFLIGNQNEAEDFAEHDDIPIEEWIEEAVNQPELAEYAADVTKRAADALESSVVSLEAKASALTSFATPLVPVAITVLGLSIAASPGFWSIVSTVAFSIVVGLLIVAAIRGYLGSGARVTGALNPRRMPRRGKTLPALRVTEADAWLASCDIALNTIVKRNRDLFAARRAIVWAFVVATLGSAALGIASNAEEGDTTESSVTITVTRSRTIESDA